MEFSENIGDKDNFNTDLSVALDFIKQFCLKNNIKVAVAESVSSGQLQSFLGSEEEAGLFFQGGITTYNCQQKSKHLLIPKELCDPTNGVSLEISQRMAYQACKLFGCDLTLSLTGYASPIPEQNIFELFAYGAVVLNGELIFSGKIKSKEQQPDAIRNDYAKMLIQECAKNLGSRG